MTTYVEQLEDQVEFWRGKSRKILAEKQKLAEKLRGTERKVERREVKLAQYKRENAVLRDEVAQLEEALTNMREARRSAAVVA